MVVDGRSQTKVDADESAAMSIAVSGRRAAAMDGGERRAMRWVAGGDGLQRADEQRAAGGGDRCVGDRDYGWQRADLNVRTVGSLFNDSA